MKCFFDSKITCMCDVLFAQINSRSSSSVIIKPMSLSHRLCGDSNTKKDQLCCRFVSVGMTMKTQLYSAGKQELFLNYQSSHGNVEFSAAYSVSGLRFVPCIVLHIAGAKLLATPN